LASPDLEGCGVLLESVAEALEAEQGVLILSNPLTGQPEFVIHNQPADRCRTYADYYGALDPTQQIRWLSDDCTMAPNIRDTPPVIDLRELTDSGQLHHSEFYADFLRPSEIEHALIAVCGSSSRTRAVMGIHRSRKRQRFSSEDVAVLELLTPLVGNHLERMLGTRVLAALPHAEAEGLILCDPQGRVLYCNDIARTLCRSISPLGAVSPLVERVPRRGDASAPPQCIPDAAPGTAELAAFVGYAISDPELLATRCGLDVSTRSVSLGTHEALLVVLGDHDQLGPQRAEVLQQRFALTAREIQVLEAMIAGATNKEIATALFVAECTVKKHMQSISAKVGARTRTGVAHAVRRALTAQPPSSRTSQSMGG